MSRKQQIGFLIPILCVLLCASLVLCSCASGPRPPEKGTPAFYWQAANQTFAAGDYVKTDNNLADILKSQNEFTARAQPWRLILTAGMSKGYMELADNYEFGARANKANPTPFRRLVNSYRNGASQLAMQFVEAFQKFQKANADPNVALAFPFPSGSATGAPQLMSKAGNGIVLQETEVSQAEKRILEKAVLLFTSRAAGAPDDTAKAREMFKAGTVQVPRGVFLLAVANALYDQGQLYSRNKLDQPERMKIFHTVALDALKTVPESKETKELSGKLQKSLKAKAS
jgi:hypothetical protein